MRLTYDPRYNIAYIRLHKKMREVETIKVSDEINVDLSPDGTIYGIELLNANKQLRKEDKGKFLIINEATGEKAEVVLSGK
ncbi:MAG: hypothetical protein COZ31_08045 [Nitrospirae bacterium CG_4_10_14_3_um_filter_44_29]|jgi:uncharacterized protein YuzE|nr:DUF2283 domain-containing protein [Nitrospirota bacterium]PIV66923.1 MAG: hypothetical protein COS10_03735 [Nitrospirae bacterium CG01_land_8_20_14_3_00_44_22]PIW90599.1 MAG: hypothetical protein COZ93_01065 [Nitrospirae bacterium CG_4_8_14_3_um_filter_44_28]PIX87887.1 MAG: hypothetical protein COZ31_08045 [Nitrospirae bacterium CG_4_10_14_3_um_filter_44_29]PJA83555.1 MAG: hypothetical protein CO147_01140 [Nitrospirae bacterium CG_4_9_14_3_um_filter_44_28]